MVGGDPVATVDDVHQQVGPVGQQRDVDAARQPAAAEAAPMPLSMRLPTTVTVSSGCATRRSSQVASETRSSTPASDAVADFAANSPAR